jgi:hypothetical protein
LKILGLALLTHSFIPLPAAWAQSVSGPRAFYGDWKRHSSGYSYRPYYFKPYPEYHGYRHHDVIHQGQHYYYYNPYSRRIWGRCSADPSEQHSYFELRGDQQLTVGKSGNVLQILGDGKTVQNAFSAVQPSGWPAIHSIGSPTRVPTSADASDHQVMEPPPDDPAPDL